jgi:hypothetical protein
VCPANLATQPPTLEINLVRGGGIFLERKEMLNQKKSFLNKT